MNNSQGSFNTGVTCHLLILSIPIKPRAIYLSMAIQGHSFFYKVVGKRSVDLGCLYNSIVYIVVSDSIKSG